VTSVITAVICMMSATPAAASQAKRAAAASSGCTASKVGGTITWGQYAQQPQVDPADRAASGVGGGGYIAALYDTLFKDDAKTGKITPYVAESYSHNGTNTQYLVKLRPGLKFGNGDAFDAAAVAASENRYLQQAGSYYAGFTNYISSIVPLDTLTVQYNLSVPWAELLVALSSGFGMISDTAVVNRLGKAQFSKQTMAGAGVGPYELSVYNPPNLITLVAKKDYWGGPVCIQQINFVPAASTQQSLDSFNTGQYTAAVLRDPVGLRQWKTATPRVGYDAEALSVGAANLFINTTSKSAHLDDVRVRQALQYANDVNKINQRAFQGALIAHTNLVPKAVGFLQPTVGPKYDPKRASQLVAAVKKDTGWDGSLSITCYAAAADFGIAYAALLDTVGFKVTVNPPLTPADYVAKVQVNHDYDIACGGFNEYQGDYWNAFFPRTVAPTNYSNFHDATWNAAVNKLTANPIGSAAFQKDLAAVQALQNTLVPQVLMGSYPDATLMQSKLQGMQFTYALVPLFGKAYLTTH
jgi:peptide/nickel transport system substrate-binding protein